jgi:hypothetical protein
LVTTVTGVTLNRAEILGLRLLGFAFGSFFDTHILEFAGFKYFATFQALHELSVFFAAYDLHAGMLARFLRAGRGRQRLWRHKSGSAAFVEYAEADSQEFPVF